MRKKIVDGKIEQEKKMRKSRAKYSCPTKLKDLIEKVNLIPVDVILPSWDELYERQKQNYNELDLGQNKTFEIFDRASRECLLYLPEKIIQYIYGLIFVKYHQFPPLLPFVLDSISNGEIGEAYRSFRRCREDLRKLIDYFTVIRECKYSFFGNEIYKDKDKDTAYRLPDINLSLMPNGTRVRVGLGFNLSILITENVDCDRIRACKICRLIFWAKNKNSETCSKTCLNILRQRKHRDKNKEEINTNRRDNYKTKKRIEKIKNGTL